MIRIKIKENYIKLELTPYQIELKEKLEIEADNIYKEIVFGIKTILFVSLIIIFGLLIYTII